MRKEHYGRLEQLAEHLESGKLAHDVFDFTLFNSENSNVCGTNGCAIGELPALFPERFCWVGNPLSALEDHGGLVQDKKHPEELYTLTPGATFFGLSDLEYWHLFFPCAQFTTAYGGERLGPKATRYDVAKNIRCFLSLQMVEPNEHR